MKLTGVVIAGGQSKRMGKDKVTIRFEGQTLLSHAVKLLEKFTDTILVSSSNTEIETSHLIVSDEFTYIGPIAGIYASLKQAQTQKILVIPVDMPLLNDEIISFLINNIQDEAMINVFSTYNRTQMLVGIYDKALLSIVETQINNNQYKLRDLLQKSSVNIIDGTAFEELFVNANTPIDLQKIKDQYER